MNKYIILFIAEVNKFCVFVTIITFLEKKIMLWVKILKYLNNVNNIFL